MLFNTNQKRLFFGFAIGMIFPIVGWALVIVTSGQEFSLSSVIRVHDANTLLFLTDLLPFVFAASFYLLGASLVSGIEGDSDPTNETIQVSTTAVTKSFLSGEPPLSVFTDMLDHLLVLTKSEFGFIGDVFHDDEGMPYLKSRSISNIAWDQASHDIYRPEGMEFRNVNSLFGHVLTTKKMILTNDPSADRRSAGTPEGHPPLDSFLGIPLMRDDQLIGMVGLANRRGGFTESLVQRIDPLISACGNVLWGMRLGEDLNDARMRFQALFDEAPVLFTATRVMDDGQVVFSECNRLFCESLGYEQDEVVGQPVKDFLTESSAAEFLGEGFAAAKTTGRFRAKINLVCKDERIIYTELVAIPDRDSSGKVVGSKAMFVDISNEVEARLKQEDVAADLALLIDTANVAIFSVDENGIVSEWNQKAVEITGYDKAEIIGRDLLAFGKGLATEEDIEALHEVLIGALGGTEASEYEFSLINRHGQIVDLSLNITARRDLKGHISGVLIVGLDISERKLAERTRIEKDRQHRLFTDELPVSIWEEDWSEVKLKLDKLGFKHESDLADHFSAHPKLLSELNYMTKIIQVNAYTYELYELLEKDGSRVAPEAIDNIFIHDRGRSLAMLYFQGGNLTDNYIVKSYKGNDITIQCHTMIPNDAKEDWSRVITIDQDRTELMRKEQELRQAKKMEAVGQLTGGIAHDFNNLLNIVNGNLQFLREEVGESGEEVEDLFDDAQSAIDDGAELTQRLLSFSRIDSLKPKVVNVSTTISKFGRFLSRTLGDNAQVEIELPTDELYINIDSAQFDNALLNLALNARDAMNEGGVIKISAKLIMRDSNSFLSSNCCPDDYVRISVSDSGVGIGDEIIDRVFDPYFTTKELGKGSGLGLSMVYGFTKQSGGCCEIDSSPNEGTTVSMYLPADTACTQAESDVEDTVRVPIRGRGSILVVEDDPRVRRVALRHVRQLGFSTLEAENADVAKTIIESGIDIDLLFSDVMMPGEINGKELADWVAGHHPHIKVILTSGFVKEKSDPGSEDWQEHRVLKKPYSAADISRQIDAM